MARGAGGRGNRGGHTNDSGGGGARGRGRGRGGGSGPPSRLVTVSKAMSFILRHGAEREGLKLDENGYARVDELLAWHKLAKLHVSFKELQSVVENNEKKRFTLIRNPATSTAQTPEIQNVDDDNPADYLIRAAQGHSIPIDHSNLLTSLTPETAPEFALHGTYAKAWPLIVKSGGLKKMGRTLIHCAPASKLPIPNSSSSSNKTGSDETAFSQSRKTPGEEAGDVASGLVRQEQASEAGAAAGVGARDDNTSKTSQPDDELNGRVDAITINPSSIPGTTQTGKDSKEEDQEDRSQKNDSNHPKEEKEEKIISGLRTSAKIHIYISLRQSMIEGGLKWWRSDNGVLLTEGDPEKGVLGVEFFEVVLDTSSNSSSSSSDKGGGAGKVLWRDGKAVS